MKSMGFVLALAACWWLYSASPPERMGPVELWLTPYVGNALAVVVEGIAIVLMLFVGLYILFHSRSRPGKRGRIRHSANQRQ
jgi:hypothetical protein